MNIKGRTDKPIGTIAEDEFQIEAYVDGLAEFIKECDTPMTIAVQGDWGCGKTSMMNMVKKKLEGDIIDVWFNTWQFSQFNMDSQLVIIFLQHLVKKLSKSIHGKDFKIGEKLVPILKKLAFGVTKQVVGEAVAEEVKEAADSLMAKDSLDFVDVISELKEDFQKLVEEASEKGKKRVVVFIDDLDRLQPVRAVELLEILKLFVDCEHCVFVMAIDTSVVFQGIREKYGDDMSAEKAQSFFDKMIQMPFRMPVAYYELNTMLEKLLFFFQDEELSSQDKKEYVRLFKKVTDGNPRSLKRLANSILLTEKVAEKKKVYKLGEDKKEYEEKLPEVQRNIRRILISLSCIQLRYESVYSFLVNDVNYNQVQKILDMSKPDRSGVGYGERLIEKLVQIGIPEIAIQDSVLFYDVMEFFIESLKTYRDCVTKNRIFSFSQAVTELMKIIRLNNYKEEKRITKEVVANQPLECNLEQGNVISAGEEKYIYLGMRADEEYEKLYESLIQKGIYLPLKWITDGKSLTQNGEVWFEGRGEYASIYEFELFQKIDNVLSGGYANKNERRSGEEIYITYSKGDWGSECKMTIHFDTKQKALYLEYRDNYCRMKEETEQFVVDIQEEYQRVQSIYSEKLIKNWGKYDFNVEKSDDGETITQLNISGIPILNEKMAEIITEYFKKIFSSLEKAQVKDTFMGFLGSSIAKI